MLEFWTNYLFQIITVVGIFILYFTLRNLLPSYFNEKGKNIATKEDVEKITQLVEGVKHTFTVETEKLKANLFYLTNVQVCIASEERNAIIEFNQKYFRWMHILTDTSFNNADYDSNLELETHKKKIGEAYTEFLNSETKLNLFVENSELIELSGKLKIATLENLSSIAPHSIISFVTINRHLKLLKTESSYEKRKKEMVELYEKRSEIQSQFNSKMITGLKIIASMQHTFQKICRDHIYQLTKQSSEVK